MYFLLDKLSYLGIILVLVLAGMGLPVPEEIPVIAAGVASSFGSLNPWLAYFACLFGAIAGDCMMYLVGRRFGRSLLVGNHRMARHLTPERERRIEKMIEAHGLKTFVIARFLVGLRSPVYLTAGILRIPFRRFLVYDVVAATSVVSVFFWLSYHYGARIGTYIKRAEIGLTVIVVTAILIAVIWYLRARRKRKFRLILRRQQRLERLAAREARLTEQTESGGPAAAGDTTAGKPPSSPPPSEQPQDLSPTSRQ